MKNSKVKKLLKASFVLTSTVLVYNFMLGKFHDYKVITPLRIPFYLPFSMTYGINMVSELNQYETFDQFFSRNIDMEKRPMGTSILVSPSDGKILDQGPVTKDLKVVIKNKENSIEHILGYKLDASKNYQFSIVYLAPGDYHRFHSPADCQFSQMKHIKGSLFPVMPMLLNFFDSFNVNERMTLKGTYLQNKEFYFSAIGAYNVGNIEIFKIPEFKNLEADNLEMNLDLKYTKGEMLGRFFLGSTILLVWETDKGLDFNFNLRDKVLVRQDLTRL